jgi:hypothetical protein
MNFWGIVKVSIDQKLLNFDEFGNLIDFIYGTQLKDTPEERVRQHFLRLLNIEYNYPTEVMDREVTIFSGAGQLLDIEGKPICADIVVYENPTARQNNDQGQIRFVVERKALWILPITIQFLWLYPEKSVRILKDSLFLDVMLQAV